MTEKKLVLILLLFLFVVLGILAAFSEGSGYGGGDSNMHMLISKFSFIHHELFVHHWGKPFFILFSAPFAQFGFFGITVFNIICALSTAYMMYLLAKEFKIENSWMIIFFSLLAPVYFVTVFSGLTEIFFSFVLVLSIFLFVKKKYIAASVIVSFLPFIRSEGYLLLLLFAFALIYRKRSAVIPFLIAGTVVYSIAGSFYYHDLLWTIHQNPYVDVKNIYGNGSLFFFLKQNEFIFGTSLVVLCIPGVIGFFLRTKEKKKFFSKVTVEEFFLVYGSFAVYFIAHSIFWWKGWFGSAGLIRVMAAVTPLVALLALRGMNVLMRFKYSGIIQVIILIAVIMMPFKQHKFPKRYDYEEVTLHRADQWIKQNNLSTGKIFYSHPFVVYDLGKDPFDPHSASEFYSLQVETPETGVNKGEIVIWDSHFSPNEGRIALQKFKDNKNFKLLNSFGSDMSVTPKDKGRFEVYIFQRD